MRNNMDSKTSSRFSNESPNTSGNVTTVGRSVARVLVACEFSGAVRDAFAAQGHDAWSCDILPSERPGKHLEAGAASRLWDGWDLMIAFPPCTHLAVSGARW